MQVDTGDIGTLLQVQHIDLELLKAKKTLEELPQRSIILVARQKKQAIEQKRDRVAELRREAEDKAAKLEDEDARLVAKQRLVQEAIDASRGDYRSVEAHTKELNGFAKRRNKLEEELEKVGEDMAKIERVQEQVSRALDEIEKQEEAAITSFQQEGGALQHHISHMSADRAKLMSMLPTELRDVYERTAARMGGVAVGRLKDGRCGACRALIDGGRLIELKAQAPLGRCPSCKRLLVVE